MNNSGITKIINWKVILIGIIAYFVVMMLIVVALYISGNYNTPDISYSPLTYIFLMSISGIITGFFSGREYLNGIINSVIVAVFYSIIMGLFSGLYYLMAGLFILGAFGLLGGLIGVIIYRKYNNYNLKANE